MIRRITHHTVLVLALVAASTGCKKKAAENKDTPKTTDVAPAKEPAAAAPAKASREECEKVVANQLALETDASIKSAMEQSKEAMTTSCMDSMSSSQAQCGAKAANTQAFADCLLQK